MTLKENLKKYPNDYDLGHFFFCNYEFLDDINEFEAVRIIKEYPNYYELGSYLRNEFKNGANFC